MSGFAEGALARSLGALAVLIFGGSAAARADALDRAISHHRDGRLPAALAAYREGIAEILDSRKIDLARLALAYHNACYVLIDLDDLATALDYCGTSLELRRDLGDERGVARSLSNLGMARQYLGYYGEAEAAFRESLEINERRGDTAAAVRNRSNLGVLAMDAGRYGEAIEFHTSAEELASQHADEPWSEYQVRIARLNLGAVLEKLGAYREALGLLRSLAAEESGGSSEFDALVQVNLGVIYRNLGDPLRAVESFDKAAATYASLGDTAGLSNAKLNLAIALHLNLRRLEEAERAYREALEYARAANNRPEEIQDLFYLGNLELETGRFAAARDSFRRCLELARASDSREGRWSGLHGLGRVTEAGDPRGALDFYRQAMAEIEEVRSSLADASMRSGYFGDKRPIYAAAVRVLGHLDATEPEGGHGREALAIVQQAKARELLEALAAAAAASSLDSEVTGLLLEDDEALLEYFLGDGELYLWIVRQEGTRMVDLGPARPILERVAQVHESLSTGRTPAAATVAYLSRTLLGGAALDGAATLRVAPDGELYHLPFEVLADPASPGAILIDRLEVSYLPSASALGPLVRRRNAAQEAPSSAFQLVGFANPELPLDPQRPRAPGSLLVSRYGFGPLPAAEREMESVSGILGGERRILLGPEATEDAFRELASRGSRVMHLATHTVVDNRPGQNAAILLAAGEDHDGVVYPEEIAALDYRARLTVLDSCWSAVGNAEEGRALASLTNAFLAAGSSSVVATLWEIDDERTAVFMEQFYHQLSRGLGVAEALRRAKMRLRATPGWDFPGLWSAYVLIGEGGRVIDPGIGVGGGARLPAWSWVLAALLLLAGLWLAPRR